MNYQKNKKSDVKNMINEFISSQHASTALVIDADTLLSSTALHQSGMKMENITIINNDPMIVDYAKSIGFNAICGISTNILSQIGGKFDIIYWDYCGFPQERSDGFNPAIDMIWGFEHLTRKGMMLATFCRRGTNCIEKAESLIPRQMSLAKTYLYFETCAMMLMIMVKKKPREIRDFFNELTVAKRSKKQQQRQPQRQPQQQPPQLDEFKTGDIVFSKWETGWLPGEIVERRQSKFDVFFEESNEVSLMQSESLHKAVKVSKKRKLDEGDLVFSQWNNKWYPGKVNEIKGSKYDIYFEDNTIALMNSDSLYVSKKTKIK